MDSLVTRTTTLDHVVRTTRWTTDAADDEYEYDAPAGAAAAEEEEVDIWELCESFSELKAEDEEDGETEAEATAAPEPDEGAAAAALELVRQARRAFTKDPMDADIFVDEEGALVVLQLLKRHVADGPLASACLRLLANLCVGHPEHRRWLRRDGITGVLLAGLTAHADEPRATFALLKMARQLATQDECGKIELDQHGVVDLALGAMDAFAEDAKVLSAALRMLCAVASEDDDSVQEDKSMRAHFVGALKDKGILDRLIDVLEGDAEAAVLHRACLLLSVLLRAKEMCEEAVDSGVIESLLALITTHGTEAGGSPLVTHAAARAMKAVAREHKDSVRAEGVSAVLLRALKGPQAAHAQAVEACAACLAVLCFKSEEECAALVGEGVVGVLVSAIAAHGADGAAFRGVCMCARNLCLIEGHWAVLKEGGIEAALASAMALHEADPVVFEFGRDVLRDMHSTKYKLGTHSMGCNLIELTGIS